MSGITSPAELIMVSKIGVTRCKSSKWVAVDVDALRQLTWGGIEVVLWDKPQ